jgi:hypothetical protein
VDRRKWAPTLGGSRNSATSPYPDRTAHTTTAHSLMEETSNALKWAEVDREVLGVLRRLQGRRSAIPGALAACLEWINGPGRRTWVELACPSPHT